MPQPIEVSILVYIAEREINRWSSTQSVVLYPIWLDHHLLGTMFEILRMNSCLHCNHLICFPTQRVWLSHCYVHKRYELLSFLSWVLSFGLQYAGKKLSLAITDQDLVTHEPDIYSVFMFEIWEEQYVQVNLGWILLDICCDHVTTEAPAVIVKLIHSCRRITLATCIRI